MTLDESTKAVIRDFLKSHAAMQWIEYCRGACPKLDLKSVDVANYHASLLIKEGWTSCAEFMVASVQEERVTEYGTPAINTVDD